MILQTTTVKDIYINGKNQGKFIIIGKISNIKIDYIRNNINMSGEYYYEENIIKMINFSINFQDINNIISSNDLETNYSSLFYMDKLKNIAYDIFKTEMVNYFDDITDINEIEKI